MTGTIYFYFAIVLLIFGIGDIIGHFTKGKLSGMMMVMLIFLIAFLTGALPGNTIELAGLTNISSLAVGMVLFNMGTTINIRQMIREWRVVAVAAAAMVASSLIMLLAIPIIGFQTVLVGIPVINGAAMATLLMTQAALEKGLVTAAALCAVIYAVQKFVGTPIASIMGRRYALKLMDEFRAEPERCRAELLQRQTGLTPGDDKKFFYETHAGLFTPNVLLAIVALAGLLGRTLGSVTPINYSIWCLLLGSVSGIGGFLPPKPLQRSQSYGFMMVAVFGGIIPSLAEVSIHDLGAMAVQTVVLFVFAVAGVFLISYILPVWKLVGDKDLSMGIGVEQFLGFPANVVICREIAEAVGETPEEKSYIEDTLSIPYILGGITVVTVLSVVVAGIVIGML
ncbi:MAG: permease [Mogibacterium sp.]|nr:permease [Mogibacterium sp.]